jgi:uncharacterized protein (TIRG00374 family)
MSFLKIPSRLLQILKYLLAVIPFIWIYWRVDIHKFANVIHQVPLWTIPVVTVVIFLAMFFQGTRWWYLLRAYSPRLPFVKTMAYHFVSVFYSTVLPTSAAQDILRTVFVSRETGYSLGWGVVWLCRILGLLALALLSLYGLLTLHRFPWSFDIRLPVLISFGVILLLFSLSFSKRSTRPFRKLFIRFLPKKITTILEDVRQVIYNYRDRKRMIAVSFLLTMFNQFCLIFGTSLVLKSVTGSFYFTECLAFIPIIEVVALSFPLTPNGMGVREALTAGMFKYLHLSNEQLGTYVLLLFIITLITRMSGSLALIAAPFRLSSVKNKG